MNSGGECEARLPTHPRRGGEGECSLRAEAAPRRGGSAKAPSKTKKVIPSDGDGSAEQLSMVTSLTSTRGSSGLSHHGDSVV